MHPGQLQAAKHPVTTDIPLTFQQSEELSLGIHFLQFSSTKTVKIPSLKISYARNKIDVITSE